MESVWSASCDIERRESLSEDIRTDVAVIGAGMAGVLIAYELANAGVEVAVIDAGNIAGGMTKNTTAKITSQHGPLYHRLIANFGEERAREYACANQAAIGRYADIIESEKINCDFVRLPSYVYTLETAQRMETETEAARRVGIDASFTRETTLPFEVEGAVRFENQAQFHPLKFIKAISKNLNIYEHTMARSVEEGIVTTSGGKISADAVVVATHYPFINTPGYYFMRLYQERSYVVALENAATLDGMYVDEEEGGHSFRNYGGLLLLGGEKHKTGKNREGGRYERLLEAGKRWYPEAAEKYRWSNQDCMSLDGVPYIGLYSDSTPGLYVATGFNKWGMTSSMVSAMIISSMILEKDCGFSEVFSPRRFDVTASAKKFISLGAEAVSGLTKEAFKMPDTFAENIPEGHGGIAELEGEKLGVYKENGRIYAVSTKCPHLGCQLEWNPDEKTWDCPCHGSRFNYRGELISNPALEDLRLFAEPRD